MVTYTEIKTNEQRTDLGLSIDYFQNYQLYCLEFFIPNYYRIDDEHLGKDTFLRNKRNWHCARKRAILWSVQQQTRTPISLSE